MTTRCCASALAAMMAVMALAGCAQRRIEITSEPEGALVYLNDTEVGRTPTEVDFTYFGVYDVVLRKDGYEPLLTTAEAKPNLWDYPGVDLAAMAIPGGTKTIVKWHFVMQPQVMDEAALLERARQLRAEVEAAPASSTTTTEPPVSDATTEQN